MTRVRRFIAGPVGILIALTATPGEARQRGPDRTWLDEARRDRAVVGPAVGDLPHARGRTFRSLDAYIAYLREYAAPNDRPWYREIRPGVYRLETGNLRTGARSRLFTREQLERRFGFRR